MVLKHVSILSQYRTVGGGGSFKNRKPIGEVGCCDSRTSVYVSPGKNEVHHCYSLFKPVSNHYQSDQSLKIVACSRFRNGT